MLHVILGILKVIGIILLAVIGLLVLILLALLFVPVRYRIAGKKEGEVLEGQVQVSWFLHIIGLTAEYAKGHLSVKLKLFGFALKRIGGGEEGKERGGGDSGFRERRQEEKAPKKKLENGGREQVHPGKTEHVDSEVKSGFETVEQDKHIEPKKEAGTPTKPPGRLAALLKRVWQGILRLGSLLKTLFEFLIYLPERILDWTQRLSDLLDAGEDAAERWREAWERLCKRAAPFLEDESRALYGRLLAHLKYLWKHYGPRTLGGWARFGTGAPDITGALTGVLYPFLPASANEFALLPDFTEAVFEADIRMKGHIRACHLLTTAVSLWREKQLRKLIRKVRAKGGQ